MDIEEDDDNDDGVIFDMNMKSDFLTRKDIPMGEDEDLEDEEEEEEKGQDGVNLTNSKKT